MYRPYKYVPDTTVVFEGERFGGEITINFSCFKEGKNKGKQGKQGNNKGTTREQQGKNKGKTRENKGKQGKLISLVRQTREINFPCFQNKGN